MVTRYSEEPGPYRNAVNARSNLVRKERFALHRDRYEVEATTLLVNTGPIHCLAVTPCFRYLLAGGGDGIIRAYNGLTSVAGEQLLTTAQRHPLQDTIQNAGVLIQWWEHSSRGPGQDSSSNTSPSEEQNAAKPHQDQSPPSPVYSLAVHSEALWTLAGNEKGYVLLYTLRHDCGTAQHCFRQHRSAVSAISLADDERSFISGGWDAAVIECDLDSGLVKRQFKAHIGQVSSISRRPREDGQNYFRSMPPAENTRLEERGANHVVTSAIDGNATPGSQSPPQKTEAFDPLFDEMDSTDTEKLPASTQNGARLPSEPETLSRLQSSDSLLLTTSITGEVVLWDARMQEQISSHDLYSITDPEGHSSWCTAACWSTDGNSCFIGRRHNTVDEWDLRAGKYNRKLRLPRNSGPVSALAVHPFGRHVAVGSFDNIRFWDLDAADGKNIPFRLIPGHHGGTLSSLVFSSSGQYLASASGDRGWDGASNELSLIHKVTDLS